MGNTKKRMIIKGVALAVVLPVLNLTDAFCEVGNCVRYKVELCINDNSRLS